MRFRFVALMAGLSAAASVQAASVSLQVAYQDDASEGFNDPTFGSARRSAFEYALGVWGSKLEASYLGETVKVYAKFDPLGGTSTSATLGQAGPSFVDVNFGSASPKYKTNTYYPDALANHLSGMDNWGPGSQEIDAVFNSDVDGAVLGSTNWYYGTNAAPGGNVDFVTVAMHELAHGLGFASSIESTGAIGAYPTIYDRFVYGANSGKTLDQMTTDAERLAAVTSGELYWDGAEGKAANGGVRPELYAPSPFENGSSVAHLDEAVFGSELMSPVYSGPDHNPGPVELGMLSDMGWTVVPEPGIVGAALSTALLALGRRQRKIA